MKSPLFSVFIVASLVVAVAHCFPGVLPSADSGKDNGKDEIDTVLVLPGRNPFSFQRPLLRVPLAPDFSIFGDDDSDDDDSSLEGFNPFRINPWRGNTFDDFLTGMQNAMNRIKEQMAGVLSGIPGQGVFGSWGKTPEGGNTTSTTKIIDGHVVTINETTYQSGDDNSNVVFRVHIVDVKPLNKTNDGNDDQGEIDLGGGEEIENVTTGSTEGSVKNDNGEKIETTTEPRSVETVEDFAGNEIPKNQNDNFNA